MPNDLIFICYRRGRGTAAARLIYDQLQQSFAGSVVNVFLDHQSFIPGDDWINDTDRVLTNASVMIVLADNSWLTEGIARLREFGDPVRRELEFARKRGDLPVVVVTTDGFRPPRQSEIKALVTSDREVEELLSWLFAKTAIDISFDQRLEADVTRLASAVSVHIDRITKAEVLRQKAEALRQRRLEIRQILKDAEQRPLPEAQRRAQQRRESELRREADEREAPARAEAAERERQERRAELARRFPLTNCEEFTFGLRALKELGLHNHIERLEDEARSALMSESEERDQEERMRRAAAGTPGGVDGAYGVNDDETCTSYKLTDFRDEVLFICELARRRRWRRIARQVLAANRRSTNFPLRWIRRCTLKRAIARKIAVEPSLAYYTDSASKRRRYRDPDRRLREQRQEFEAKYGK